MENKENNVANVLGGIVAGSLDHSFIEDPAFRAEMDQLVAERDKQTIENLERIEKEIYEHPLYEQLPAKEVTGLYTKAVQLAGFNPMYLFEEPNLDGAADQIKFLRYAIALQSIQEWIDGKFRIGRQEEISPEILTKMQKYNFAGALGYTESFKAEGREANVAKKIEDIIPEHLRASSTHEIPLVNGVPVYIP